MRASSRRICMGRIAGLYLIGGVLSTGPCAQTVIKTDASWGRTATKLAPSASNTSVTGNRGASYAV